MTSRSEETETKVYINWINIKLKSSGHKVSSLEDDFKFGVNTNALTQSLLSQQYKYLEKPRSEFQYVQNNNLALDHLRKDGCVLHGTDGMSITSGNKSITRGFIWQLMLTYQINKNHPGKSIAEARRDALEFINRQLATLSEDETTRIRMLVGDFNRVNDPIRCKSFDSESFNDGAVLAGLCVSINNNARNETLKKIENKCNSEKISPTQPNGHTSEVAVTYGAISTAEECNNIPILIEADDIVNAFEGNSVWAYISYYMHAQEDEIKAKELEKATIAETAAKEAKPTPEWDEIKFLLNENNDKNNHKIETKNNDQNNQSISIDMPTMQKIQSDLNDINDVLVQFEKYVEENPGLAEDTPQIMLYKRICAHKARLLVDLENYQFSIQKMNHLNDEKSRLLNEKDVLEGTLAITVLENDQNKAKIVNLEQEIAKLMQEKDDLEKKLAEMENQLDKKQQEIDVKNDENNALKVEVENAKQNNKDLTSQLANTTQMILVNEGEKAKLVHENEELMQEIAILKAKDENLDENVKKLTQDLALAREEATKSKNECDSLRAELVTVKGEYDSVKNELEKLKKENAKLQQQHDDLQTKLTDHEHQCETQHIAEIGMMGAKLTMVENDKKILQSEIEEKDAKLNENVVSIRKKDDEITSLQRQLEAQQGQNGDTNAQLQELLARLAKLEQELKEREEQLAEKNGENNKNSDEIAKLLSEIALLTASITTKQQEIDDLTKELEQLKILYAQVVQERDQLQDENDELKKLLEELRAKIVILETQNAEYLAKINQLRSQLQETQDKLNKLQVEYDDVIVERDVAVQNCDELLKKIEILEDEKNDSNQDKDAALVALRLELNTVKDEVKRRDGEIDEKNKHFEEIELLLKSKNDEIDLLKQELDRLGTEIQSKNQEIDEKDIQLQKNQAELSDKDTLLAAQLVEIAEKNDFNNTLTAQLDVKTSENDDLRALLKERDDEIERLKKESEEIEQLRQKLALLASQLATTQSEIIELQRVNELRDEDNERDKLKREMEMEEEIKRLKGVVMGLEQNHESDLLEIQRLNGLLQQRNSEIERLSNQTGSENDKLMKLTAENRAKSDELRIKNEQLNSKNDELELKNQELKNKNDHNNDLEKDNKSKQDEIIKLMAALKAGDDIKRNLAEKDTKEKKLIQEKEQLNQEKNALNEQLELQKKQLGELSELKKKLSDYKKKNPDGSCGCGCCDHQSHKKDPKGDSKSTIKLQDELDAMNSKYNALKDEQQCQRDVHKNELQEMKDLCQEQQIENDKLIATIQKLQEKLKSEGRFDPNEDGHLNAAQITSSNRQDKVNKASELLQKLKPQAGISLATKDPEEGGIKVAKVHVNKAAYVAGVQPNEIITTVQGVDVDKEKFAELWKSEAKAGSTLLLQVNGVSDRTGKKYHRTVKMDLGSNVANVHDVKALKRMADGVVRNGDDEIIQRVQQAQDDYENASHNEDPNNGSTSSKKDISTPRKTPVATTPTPNKSTTPNQSARNSITSPNRSSAQQTPLKTTSTASSSRPLASTTPMRSSLTSPTTSSAARAATISGNSNSNNTPKRNPITPASPSLAKKPTTSTPLSPGLRKSTTNGAGPAQGTAGTPKGVNNNPLNANPTTRTAPPRGSLGGPPPLADSRLMQQRRAEQGQVASDIAKLAE